MFISSVPPVLRSFRSTNNNTKTALSAPLSVLPIPPKGQAPNYSTSSSMAVYSNNNSSDNSDENRPDSTGGTNTGTGNSTDGDIRTSEEVKKKKKDKASSEQSNNVRNDAV